MPDFTCQTCAKTFQVAAQSLEKYPNWKPRICLKCRDRETLGRSGSARPRPSKPRSQTAEEDLTLAEVLEKYHQGPQSGVFTDGASHPNPGPGGWGAVFVRGGQVIKEACGHEPATTNNRMELVALIRGCALVPQGEKVSVWTDSQLCVNTITQWAPGWEKNGWRRKTGPIKNLELVQELYALCKARPELELKWIKAHSGVRWNEYADALATAYRRDKK